MAEPANTSKASICPQRILNEARRLLEVCIDLPGLSDEDAEALNNNYVELEDLGSRLYKAGITKI